MEEKWITQKKFYEEYRNRTINLSPLLPPMPNTFLRLLLFADGSVTHFLESLFLKTIAFELESQSEIILSEKDAKRLSLPKGSHAIERKGWLTLGPLLAQTAKKIRMPNKKRLLYAISIFPIAKLSQRLHQEILLGQKPLGQIIADQELLSRRHHIEIGQFQYPAIAQGFGFAPNEQIWARRYQLMISSSVSGLLFEAISPTVSLFKDQHATLGKTPGAR